MFCKRRLAVYRLRKFLRKLYEGYPTRFFFGYEDKHELQQGINVLLEDKIVQSASIKDKNGNERYGLRIKPEGLRLVEGWHIERLTHWIIGLAIGLFILGIVQIVIIYMQNHL